jgi:peptide/nickel transport system substrate-binding protein
MRQIIVWVMVLWSLVACQLPVQLQEIVTQATPLPRGGRVTMAVPGSLQVLQPWQLDTRASEVLVSLTLSGLMRHDETGIPQPELLSEWQSDRTGTVITATLKSDLRWSDTQPLTSSDVVYTYTTLNTLPTTTPLLQQLRVIESVTAIDERRVRFALTQPYAPLVTLWSLPILPAHILQTQPIATLNLRTLSVGSGPFVLQQITAEGEFVLDANPYYVRGVPLLDGITLLPDSSAGSVTADRQVQIYESPQPIAMDTAVYSTSLYAENVFTAVAMNTRASSQVNEVAVRRALVAAVDADDMITRSALTNWRPTLAAFMPSAWIQASYVVSDTSDIQPMLYAAGWRWNEELQSYVVDDEAVALRMLVNADNQDQLAMANILVQQWQNQRIQVDIEALPRSAYLARLVPPYDFDLAMLTVANGRSSAVYADTLLYDPDIAPLFGSDFLNEGPPDPRASLNVVGMTDVQFDQNSRIATRSYATSDRQAVLPRLQERINDIHPYVFVARPYTTVYWSAQMALLDGAFMADSPWYLASAYRWYVRPVGSPNQGVEQ